MKKFIASLSLVAFAGCFSGCTMLKIHGYSPDGKLTTICTSYAPAWPWQDSTKNLENLAVKNSPTNFNATIKGYVEETNTNTNAVDLVSQVVSAAVSAAIKAALKTP